MKRKSAVFVVCATCLAAIWIAVSPAAAQTFYREEFNAMDGAVMDTTMAFHGWDGTHIGTFDPDDPTPGDNDVGVVPGGFGGDGFFYWYNINKLKSPIVTVTEAAVTAAGEIAAPITPVPDLAVTWGMKLLEIQDNAFNAVTGIPIRVRAVVQMENGSWYASATEVVTGDTGLGEAGAYTTYSVPFSSDRNEWLNLTLNTLVPNMPTPQGATLGGTPAIDLAGGITGAGLVATFSQRGTLHINFLEIGVPPIPGDVSGDGLVTIEDFNTIRMNFGMTDALRTDGDLTGPGPQGLADGIVDLYDFGQWKDNFPFPGGGSGSLSLDGAAVPEPASALLIAIPLISALRIRRRPPQQHQV
jgi:hypothetical protein